MKRLIFLLMAVLMLGLVGCGDSPSKAAKDFYYLIEKGKVNDAFSLFTKEGQGLMSSLAGGAAALSEETKKIEVKKGIKEIQVLSEEKKGDTATVKLKIIYNNGTSQEEKNDLIKEDGKWKLAIKK
jgi:hypothetical protein